MSDSMVRIRRMSGADLERVLEIAESLREAPHWVAAAYAAALDEEHEPRRVAVVAERDPGRDLSTCESGVGQTSGAKAPDRSAAGDAGTEVPAYQSPTYESAACHASKLLVVGFAVAAIVVGEAELETIAVVESEQRRRVGGQLLRALLDELKTQQVRNLNLEVRASNHRALGFYGAHGFEETGRRLRYYAEPEEDAVLMRFRLA